MPTNLLAVSLAALVAVSSGAMAGPAKTAPDAARGALYDHDRPDPRYGNYRAERYRVAGEGHGLRQLGHDDRIYRGGDGAYYCRRADGTTGLMSGGLGSGLLNASMAPGDSQTLGTILGGISGAVLSQTLHQQRDAASCR